MGLGFFLGWKLLGGMGMLMRNEAGIVKLIRVSKRQVDLIVRNRAFYRASTQARNLIPGYGPLLIWDSNTTDAVPLDVAKTIQLIKGVAPNAGKFEEKFKDRKFALVMNDELITDFAGAKKLLDDLKEKSEEGESEEGESEEGKSKGNPGIGAFLVNLSHTRDFLKNVVGPHEVHEIVSAEVQLEELRSMRTIRGLLSMPKGSSGGLGMSPKTIGGIIAVIAALTIVVMWLRNSGLLEKLYGG